MKPDPFSVITDERVRKILARLHDEAEKQMPRMKYENISKLPSVLMGRPVTFTEEEMRGQFSDKYLALEKDQAAFVHLLARSKEARLVVEFGSSFGVSTIWLADAVRHHGGRVIATELVEGKAEKCMENVREAGLEDCVEMRVGNALETLDNDDIQNIDFFLNDGFPNLALDVLKLLAPKMKCGAIVLTDNVNAFPANYKDYLDYIRSPENGFLSTNIPYKGGTEMSIRV